MRPEIETLKIIGAAKSWIFKPLVLQGILFGTVGTLLSIGAVGIFVRVIIPRYFEAFLPKGVVITSMSWSSLGQLVLVGLLSALVGAFFTWPLVSKPAEYA